jgi:predicted HicB family RNase H-like nuclease
MKAMEYKGYHAAVEFDGEDGILVGRVLGINDVVGFHGESVGEMAAAFHAAIDDYLDACAKLGKSPDKAYSGQLMVRVDPAVHAQAAKAAEMTGKSLAQWAEEHLSQAAQADISRARATH